MAHSLININAHTFQRVVQRWFKQYGRKHLPWQQNPTPYRVWISEIMLQQTQVTTVIPYFEKFIQHFPTVKSLAKATDDKVLHLWTGLGYYSRARNLLKTAKIIATTYHGKFPTDLATMQTLPGIGRSTAAAILALSMQQHATILDGNVKRVLSRITAITAWNNENKLWDTAEYLTPKKNVAAYTQAMMDLGSMVCTRTQPKCHECPLSTMCLAHQQQNETLFPGKKPTKIMPVKQIQLLILKHKGKQILLEKRPSSGIWGGLWSLPEYHEEFSKESLKHWCNKTFMVATTTAKCLPMFRHTFTHFHLDITPIEVQVTTANRLENDAFRWHNLQQPVTFGLAAPIKKLLALKT
jgi:A/G-specific adenine glycosylase